MNKLEVLAEFERVALDAPLGKEGAELLEQLERIAKLVEELKAYYKAALTRDPHCVPGWTLKPGAKRRSLGDPAKVWDRLSDILSSQQFMVAVTIKVLALQEIWSRAAGVPASRAKETFNQLMDGLLIELESAPSLVRTKS